MDQQLNCFCFRINLRCTFATKHKSCAAKRAISQANSRERLCSYLSNLESYLELFGRLDKEPQALLHHVGSQGAREMSCDDEKLWPAGTQSVKARRTADWVQICNL